MNELITVAKQYTDPKDGTLGRWGFVYEMGNFYFHTMWVQGFGGRIFKQVGNLYEPLLNSPAMLESMKYVRKLQAAEVCPPGASGTLVTQLFNRGRAMFVVSGQWFRGEIAKNINYGVASLPIIDESKKPAVPFLTVEGYFMARHCRDQKSAFEVIKYFTSGAMGRYMGIIGKHTPANRGAYQYPAIANEEISKVFRRAADLAVPMPNNPEMALTWSPATSALNDVLGGANIEQTLEKYQKQLIGLIADMRKANK
jgi:arabinogalactan oligomer/maltooligosaccharide transport system substrate-binding protein